MNSERPTIGFVGLGLMGGAMAARLVASGFKVTGFDVDPDKLTRIAAHGVSPAASLKALCAVSEVVLICVTTTRNVVDIVAGPEGIIGAPGQVKVVVDHSTTIADEARRVASELHTQCGIGVVDAPVSGGPPAAEAGTLAIMAGGEASHIATIEPVMSALASTFTHMGPSGAGQVTKMVNQTLVLNNYCVLAEALALAEAGGVDADKITAALASGHAGSNMLQSMFPRLVARDFEPAGYARQILKDLDMLADLARELKVPTPMSAQSATLYRMLIQQGHGELDGIAILKLFQESQPR